MILTEQQLSIDDYHRSKRVSHHKLRTFADIGPRGYVMRHVQGTSSDEDSDAKQFGRALEDAVQRPTVYRTHYVGKPAGMSFGSAEGDAWRAIVTGKVSELSGTAALLVRIAQGAPEQFAVKPADMKFNLKPGKEWKAAQEAAGLTVITEDEAERAEPLRALLASSPGFAREILDAEDRATIDALLGTLETMPRAQALMAAAKQQLSIVHEGDKVAAWFEERGSRMGALPGLQARPDWLCLSGCGASEYRPYTLDLKSTLTLSKLESGRGIAEYGYHSQAANTELCLRIEGIDVTGMRHFLLAGEKAFPHRWRIVEMPRPMLSIGEAWCYARLSELSQHYATGDWPLVMGDELVVAHMPRWMEDEAA